MDIFEFAMEKEKYSEQFYRELARRTTYTGFKSILTMLADEEAKHYRTVEKMKTETPEVVTNTPVLANARKIFENMKGSAGKFSFPANEVDLYRKACDIEEESRAFYLEKAEQVEDPGQKRIFQMLAEEENKHFMIVENIRSFVARPQTYLDNPEFVHFDDYIEGVF